MSHLFAFVLRWPPLVASLETLPDVVWRWRRDTTPGGRYRSSDRFPGSIADLAENSRRFVHELTP